MKNNYISLNRKIFEWGWYKNPNTCRLFVHILLKANYKDKVHEGIEIKRGSFITSEDTLARELGITRSKVRTALRNLVKTKEVKISPTKNYSYITVNKYDKYQMEMTHRQVIAKSSPSDSQVIATTNKDNKENKENNVVLRIDAVYNTCVKDEYWIEQLCMSNRKNKKQVIDRMKEFANWLKDKDERNVNPRTFKSSFAGFLRKKDFSDKKNRHDDLIL